MDLDEESEAKIKERWPMVANAQESKHRKTNRSNTKKQ